MQFELRSNGKVEVELTPETDIENAFVSAFLKAAEKGSAVKITPSPSSPSAMIVAIQK